MKAKMNARQRREAEQERRGTAVKRPVSDPVTAAAGRNPAPVKTPPVRIKPDPVPEQTPEEETREFLEYLDRYNGPVMKEDADPCPPGKRNDARGGMGRLNLEEGMPLVEEALDRMNMGLQEMRAGRIRVVKLIHGYGSTGRGGKICAGVRKELAEMKRKKFIREFIPGERFGPLDAASRKLAEQDRGIVRDPDYGRMNHGITVVVL